MKTSQGESAAETAAENYLRNLAAMGKPEDDFSAGITWLFCRDGSLTCKTENGQWLVGNSLPMRTAERMLRDLDVSESVSCFLDVPHAAFLKLALGRLQPNQAIIAVVPDEVRLTLLLHCEDFSADIERNRLCFAAGEEWPARLCEIFSDHPGLPTPSTFIRTSLTEDGALQEMIAKAQTVFATENVRRKKAMAEQLRATNAAPSNNNKSLCVISPSMFRLWDFSAAVLAKMLVAKRFDPDNPASASPLALAIAAKECDAIVAANIARADGVFPMDRPWITWITRAIIPSYISGTPDQLLLADPAWQTAARQAGWPVGNIAVAGWPPASSPRALGKDLVVIADTVPVEAEPEHFELSSHALLWETIRLGLEKNPFDLRDNPGAYLFDLLKRCNVSADGLDQVLFIEKLIVPAYQQAIGRLLVRSELPVRFFGRGWGQLAEFAPYAGAEITSKSAFDHALAQARVLVHISPMNTAHPISAMGLPVLYSAGADEAIFLRHVTGAAADQLRIPPASSHPICAELIYSRI